MGGEGGAEGQVANWPQWVALILDYTRQSLGELLQDAWVLPGKILTLLVWAVACCGYFKKFSGNSLVWLGLRTADADWQFAQSQSLTLKKVCSHTHTHIRRTAIINHAPRAERHLAGPMALLLLTAITVWVASFMFPSRKARIKNFKEHVQRHTCKSSRVGCAWRSAFLQSQGQDHFHSVSLCISYYCWCWGKDILSEWLTTLVKCMELLATFAAYGKGKKIIIFHRYYSSSKAELTDLYRGMW